MSITAVQLGRTGTRSKEIETVVRDLIQTADVALGRHPKGWGRNVMPFDLPVNFNFSGLERKDAQRVVYVAVAQSLEERGFTVKILIEETICTMFIEWVSDIDTKEIAEMNRFLEQRQIVGNEVQGFLDKRRRKAADPTQRVPRPPRPPMRAGMPFSSRYSTHRGA